MEGSEERDLKSKGGGILIYYKQELSIVDITSEYNGNIDYAWVKVMTENCNTVLVGIFL